MAVSPAVNAQYLPANSFDVYGNINYLRHDVKRHSVVAVYPIHNPATFLQRLIFDTISHLNLDTSVRERAIDFHCEPATESGRRIYSHYRYVHLVTRKYQLKVVTDDHMPRQVQRRKRNLEQISNHVLHRRADEEYLTASLPQLRNSPIHLALLPGETLPLAITTQRNAATSQDYVHLTLADTPSDVLNKPSANISYTHLLMHIHARKNSGSGASEDG